MESKCSEQNGERRALIDRDLLQRVFYGGIIWHSWPYENSFQRIRPINCSTQLRRAPVRLKVRGFRAAAKLIELRSTPATVQAP